jgi:hypothetical protein
MNWDTPKKNALIHNIYVYMNLNVHMYICTPGDIKHEPSKMNYYTFGDELTPLGVNSLYSL